MSRKNPEYGMGLIILALGTFIFAVIMLWVM
jgi:hypothetical protein